MTFDEVMEQAIALLQRRGRISYRALKRQFDLDDEYVEDLKVEIIEVHKLAVDQDGKMLVWIGESAMVPEPVPPSTPAALQPTTQEDPSAQVASPPTAHRSPESSRSGTPACCQRKPG